MMRADALARATFEVYPMSKFMIVVPEHVMVPHHDILRESEIAQICDIMHIARNTLPIIRSDDPVAIWLGLRPRMVVRVQRLVDTVGIDIAYQRCV
jgi:DNA-directed RNA polymerase I, II, and III subunit RPABC1